MGDFWEFVEAAYNYWGSAVIALGVAAFVLVIDFLCEQRSGAEGLPWYVSVIIFLLFSPFIGYRLWLDQRHVHRKEIQNLKESHQQTEDVLHQQVADLKVQLDKDVKREVQRQTVARILKEGQGILPPYHRRERAPDTPYSEWVKKGAEDLHKFVGEEYATLWESYEGIPVLYNMDSSIPQRNRTISGDIARRIVRLREILAKLGD